MPAVQLVSSVHTQSTNHIFRFRFDSLDRLLSCRFIDIAPYFHTVSKGSVGRMTMCEIEPFRQELEFRLEIKHDMPQAVSLHEIEQRLPIAQRVARKRYGAKPCCLFLRPRVPMPRSHHVYVYS